MAIIKPNNLVITVGEEETAYEILLEYQRAKVIDEKIRGPKSIFQKTIDNAVGKKSLYNDPQKMRDLQAELKEELATVMEANGIKKSQVYASKSLDKYLDKSELADWKQRAGRITGTLSRKQAAARLKVAYLDIEKNMGVLKINIDQFRINQKALGRSDAETLRELVKLGKEKIGFQQGFAAQIKKDAAVAVRRERAGAQLDAYAEVTPPRTKWQWITVNGPKACPDCLARAGVVLTLARWRKIGTPGSGATICGAHCFCKLIPLPIAEKQFPQVKMYNIKKDDVVLTTDAELRTLKAKSNRPKKGK